MKQKTMSHSLLLSLCLSPLHLLSLYSILSYIYMSDTFYELKWRSLFNAVWYDCIWFMFNWFHQSRFIQFYFVLQPWLCLCHQMTRLNGTLIIQGLLLCGLSGRRGSLTVLLFHSTGMHRWIPVGRADTTLQRCVSLRYRKGGSVQLCSFCSSSNIPTLTNQTLSQFSSVQFSSV